MTYVRLYVISVWRDCEQIGIYKLPVTCTLVREAAGDWQYHSPLLPLPTHYQRPFHVGPVSRRSSYAMFTGMRS